MKSIKIVSEENYLYETDEDPFSDPNIIGFLGIVADVGEAMIDLHDRIQAKVKSHEMYKYFDNVYVGGIILEIEGTPVGIVTFLDDAPYFVPFQQGEKIQESE